MYSDKTHINIGTEEEPFWMPRISDEVLKVMIETAKYIMPIGWKI